MVEKSFRNDRNFHIFRQESRSCFKNRESERNRNEIDEGEDNYLNLPHFLFTKASLYSRHFQSKGSTTA